MHRAILHSDMNCFYASVEMMLNPSLKGKAVAVCGATEDRHGIVLAKSELAKKAGVKTGMVNWEAERVCPGLILVQPHYDQYLKYSELAHQIYYRYTDLVEPFGMDECWLDVTSSTSVFGSAEKIAEEIRQATKNELGLTVSIGVSYNKIFAKLGSDMKKPDAITVINPVDMKTKVWPLKADEMIYCGRATMKKLESHGIHTIGDIAKIEPKYLKSWLGINGVTLWQYANGLDNSRVMQKDFVSPVKSLGHGITCTADLVNNDEVWKVMYELAQDIGHKLRIHKLEACGVQIFIRGDDLFGKQYQCCLEHPTQNHYDIAKAGFDLFKSKYIWVGNIRSITIRAIRLQPKSGTEQLDLFSDYKRREKKQAIDNAIDELRRRFGKTAISYASLMGDLKMPGKGVHEVIMPSMMYK